MSKRRGRAGSIGSATRCRDSVIPHLELGRRDPPVPFFLVWPPTYHHGMMGGRSQLERQHQHRRLAALIIEGLDVRDRNAFFFVEKSGFAPPSSGRALPQKC